MGSVGVESGLQRNGKGIATMKMTSGFPFDFKTNRKEAWEHLTLHWGDYIQQDTFHVNAHSCMIDLVLRYRTHDQFTLIDFGCGDGTFLYKLSKRASWSRLVGIDFCDSMLVLAQDAFRTDTEDVEFRSIDIEARANAIDNLDLFDIVTAAFVLDEIEDVDAFFLNVAAALKPDGHLVVATLDGALERLRYKNILFDVPASDQPIVLSKPLIYGGAELYRVLRHEGFATGHALRNGFELVEQTTFSPSDLNSRSTGPGVQLEVWKKIGRANG